MQVPHEVVPGAAQEVVLAADQGVFSPGNHDQVEVFVFLDESVGQPQGHIGMRVVVEFAVDQQQLARQVGGQRGVGDRLHTFGTDVTVVMLGPHRQVDGVIVVTRRRDRDLVEVGVHQHRAGGGERTGGLTGDPDAAGVEPRVPVPEFADRGHVVV